MKPNQKYIRTIKGKGLDTQPQKRLHHKYLVGSKKSSNELGYPHCKVGRPAGGAVRRLTDKMFMQTVHKNVFLILNSVPVTFVTDPELIRPSIPVMTHSLDQKVMTRKAKA